MNNYTSIALKWDQRTNELKLYIDGKLKSTTDGPWTGKREVDEDAAISTLPPGQHLLARIMQIQDENRD